MTAQGKLKQILTNDWVIALFLLIVFLLTNGYTYGWDDQHLEIPMLKSLIDPSLYAGDYYVEALKKNFMSFFYLILARLISVEQIPETYISLYLLCRYFFLFWVYKIWKILSGKKFTALMCSLTILLVGRVEEFLYRTFSHQEFTLAIIVAGIYYFYKERFLLAGILLGIAVNFHALYSLFPFMYMATYLLLYYKKYGWKTIGKTFLSFLIFSLPFFIWAVWRYIASHQISDMASYKNWQALFLLACPQNFIFNQYSLAQMGKDFRIFLTATQPYWVLITFYLLNFLHNPKFRADKKSQVLIGVGVFSLLFSFVFSYFYPVRFVLDLNLIRHGQYILFILMGYTAILVYEAATEKKLLFALAIALAFPFIRFGSYVIVTAGWLMIFTFQLSTWLSLNKKRPWRQDWRQNVLLVLVGLGLLLCLWVTLKELPAHRYNFSAKMILGVTLGLLCLNALAIRFIRDPKKRILLRKLFLVITLALLAINFLQYHVNHLRMERKGEGFWQMQRNWIDMQNYVRTHTPKNALLLTPYDMEMGGFRMFSQRKVLVCYRDCGIVGFDYPAAVEWQRRVKDVEHFKVFIDGPLGPAIMAAVLQYKVNYIIFMRYFNPGNAPFLEPVYQNEVYSLYKILPNPVE